MYGTITEREGGKKGEVQNWDIFRITKGLLDVPVVEEVIDKNPNYEDKTSQINLPEEEVSTRFQRVPWKGIWK